MARRYSRKNKNLKTVNKSSKNRKNTMRSKKRNHVSNRNGGGKKNGRFSTLKRGLQKAFGTLSPEEEIIRYLGRFIDLAVEKQLKGKDNEKQKNLYCIILIDLLINPSKIEDPSSNTLHKIAKYINKIITYTGINYGPNENIIKSNLRRFFGEEKGKEGNFLLKLFRVINTQFQNKSLQSASELANRAERNVEESASRRNNMIPARVDNLFQYVDESEVAELLDQMRIESEFNETSRRISELYTRDLQERLNMLRFGRPTLSTPEELQARLNALRKNGGSRRKRNTKSKAKKRANKTKTKTNTK